jgi:hypothetical protein
LVNVRGLDGGMIFGKGPYLRVGEREPKLGGYGDLWIIKVGRTRFKNYNGYVDIF